ncbi:tetratricopeptide repeat protein [Idiomarina xiamenensis]|uniref:Uncharacterized protein n=1 Tax=Idiomarina xiamenensis 10-D-4 TaxID=740709 RepID=K2K5I3_9GAMM|nr:hypothetical protein [Idiomarina xiamenensis]EKE82848.1 hypothetical protein A10D4_09594 [Idiomarina xiamenensis 10-D-4]
MSMNLSKLLSAMVLASSLALTPVIANAAIDYSKIPSAEQVEAKKQARGGKALSERVGRAIMGAYELYEEEKINEAISELEDISTSATYDEAYVSRFLGNLYAGAERFDEAIASLKKAVAPDVLSFTDHGAALRLLADLSLQAEQYQQALEYYGKWLMFTGNRDPEIFTRIANAYYQLEQYADVIEPADLAIEYYEEPNQNPYIMKMASYYERKMFPQAIQTLEAGINAIPGNTKWWPQLGQFYMLNEQYDKALQTMEIAYLAGYLDTENHYKMLVQLYANNNVPYKAGQVMEKHLKNGDIEKTATNYASAANSYHIAKEFDEAAELYGKAAELADNREDKAEYYRKQGNILLLNEQYVAAADPLMKSLDNGYERPGSVYMSLAEAFYHAGDFRRALNYANKAADYDNTRRNARSWAGYIRAAAERKGVKL